MAQVTHVIHGTTSGGLIANVSTFLINNPTWVVTGGINYNGSYYYQGVINTSTNYLVILQFAATLGQTLFSLIDFLVEKSLTPALSINGVQQDFGVDYTIDNNTFTWSWISGDFTLSTTDLIQLEFTYTP
jgi:hypothetical protein